MTPELLLQHFNRISEAPDAIPRLRRFILDLAVRGKLVEQDPSDEPASELLKRIEAEKAKRIKTGAIRSARSLERPDVVNPLFVIPNLWCWVKLADVGVIVGGGTPSSGDPENFTTGGAGIAWLTPADLGKFKGLYVSHGVRDLTEKGLRSSSATLMPKGAVLFTSRAPIGYTAIASNEIATNQGFKSVVPYFMDCSRYIVLYLQAFGPWIDSKASGTTFREVSGKIVAGLPLPLPPLAEQQRIVAKVDELMALCDQLEAERNQREAHRDKLVTASLNRISTTTAEEATQAARFHLNHLPRLTTKPEHIKQLRKTILNLAVRGRLVAQDPNEEPAAELLKLIQAEKGKSGFDSRCDVAALRETAFDLPVGWEWVAFGQIMISRDGERIPVSKEERNNRAKLYDYYGASGVIDKIDSYLFDKPLLLIGEDGANLINRSTPIAFIARGRYWVNNHAHVLDGISEEFLRFIELYINAIDLKPYVTGTAQPKMNQAKMNSIPIAVPPLAEQQRIVAKVDQLMSLCDQLEAQLTTTATDSRRLLEAVLRDALQPNTMAA
jgi:type I restriction enzyme S subunit